MDQIANMGFQTPNYLPYKIVGSPLYLEQADIILHGLGQLQVTFSSPFLSVIG